ncbi:MAG TPA: hypothetical protein VMY35_17010 [Phycisphaerae bacterium]|nr:hypothetical protein [Phycisphaerae bacterium]
MPTRRLVITLEHDSPTVPVDAFLTVVQESVELLRDADRIKAGTFRTTMRWLISDASMHSPIQLTLEPSALKANEPITDVIEPCLRDIDRLERGERPLLFSPDMQERAKQIVSVLGRGIRAIHFNSSGFEVTPTQRVAARVDELTERYFEVGSVEGRLEVLSVHGKDSVKVWDARWHCGVKCLVSDAQLQEATNLLGKRVSVRGRIRCEYRRPKEIVDVFEIRSLGETATLPQAEDFAPIDLTGGKEPADYLRGSDDD